MAHPVKRILVVEDNPALSGVVRFNLERAGFEVVVRRDGKEGQEALDGTPFDLAIIDHQLPEMTGTELCRHMRRDHRYWDVPIVMLTAKKFELDLESLRNDFGVREVMSKPFSPRALLRIVEEYLLSPAVDPPFTSPQVSH